MKTNYLVNLEEEADPQLHAFLLGQGAELTSEFGEWRVPADFRGSVKAELGERQLKFRLRFEFTAEPGDSIDKLAAFLGIDVLMMPPATTARPLLAKDPENDSLVANSTMVDLLKPVTSELEWQRYSDTTGDLWSLASASELPDPIDTPHAFATIQGGNGLWMVMDDGRSIITGAGLRHLRVSGIAWSTKKVVDGRVLPHPVIPVFGGRVLDVIDRHHVELAFPPLYLLPEQSTIAPW